MCVVILSYIQFYMYLSQSCLSWNYRTLNCVFLSIQRRLPYYKLKRFKNRFRKDNSFSKNCRLYKLLLALVVKRKQIWDFPRKFVSESLYEHLLYVHILWFRIFLLFLFLPEEGCDLWLWHSLEIGFLFSCFFFSKFMILIERLCINHKDDIHLFIYLLIYSFIYLFIYYCTLVCFL